MKKTYLKPEFKVVKLHGRMILQTVSNGTVNTVSGNVFSSEVKGGTGTARSRGDWDDEEFAE